MMLQSGRIDALVAECDALRAERDKLRAALRDIATEANEGGVFHPGICADSEHRNAYVVQMANAALKPPPDNPEWVQDIEGLLDKRPDHDEGEGA